MGRAAHRCYDFTIEATPGEPLILGASQRTAIERLCVRYGVRRLWVYGSALTDRFSIDSDLDVLVEFGPEQVPTYFELARMEDELSRIVGDRKVDLHTPEELSPYFREDVIQGARIEYVAA